jgi:hypothetical protein
LIDGENTVMTDATIDGSGGRADKNRTGVSGGAKIKMIEAKPMMETKAKGVGDSGGATKMIIKTLRTLQKILLPAADLERRIDITRRILEKCDKLNAKQ